MIPQRRPGPQEVTIETTPISQFEIDTIVIPGIPAGVVTSSKASTVKGYFRSSV
jgi:hypothetical protein